MSKVIYIVDDQPCRKWWGSQHFKNSQSFMEYRPSVS